MTQEEKAKAYDEALKKARILVGYPTTQPFISDLQDLFPELKESEDERMMNQLHSWMKEFGGAEEYTEKVYQWIKGLIEKQGEHAKFCDSIQVGDKVTRNEDGVLVNLSQLKRVAKKDEKQGNNMGISEATKQKLEDNLNKALEKETPESWNEFLDEQGEHKTWSEEDEDILNTIINHFKVDIGCTDEDDIVRWLKFLKDRVQPKREWNEEDKEQLDRALYMMEQLDMTKSWDDVYNWLKSLRPQSQWKPSKEQMQALSDAGNSFRPFEEGHKVLWSLYNDLKKLREK